ncbi:MAG: fibronectin type III domain-containing protein, partial [Nitrospinota bacterium]|nr:fibronectin type III domain-containing protein [Nitrospinota bacterium]
VEGGKIRSNYLEWTPIEDEDVGGYKIYRVNKADGSLEEIADISGGKNRNYTDYGGGKPLTPKLADNTSYSYRITAYNVFKTEGPHSKPVSTTTAPPPTVPTGFSAKGMQPRMVPLTWDTHTDNNVKGYIISRSDSPDGPFTEVTNIKGREINNFVDKGGSSAGGSWGSSSSKGKSLDDAHLYFYKVQAYNWVGARSKFTNAVSVLTKPVSFPPENFTATSDRPGQVPLEWRPVPDITIDWYEVFRSETKDGEFKKLGAIKSDKSYYLDEKLPNGKTYYYKVRALDKFGLIGEFTEAVSATTKQLPTRVSGIKWEIISGEPTLLWASNPEVDIKEYIIYEKGFFGWSKVGSSGEPMYIIKGLANGSTSNYSVSAVDTAGLEGDRSESITVRP